MAESATKRSERILAGIDKSLKEFNAEIEKVVKILMPQQVVLMHKKISMEALKRVVMKTPVDTGRCRGNWQTTISSPAAGVLNVVDKEGDAVNVGKKTHRRATTAINDAVLNAGKQVLQGLQAYQAVFITNNVSYAIWLEDGSSKQAPKGMVKVTIEELKGMFP